MDIMPLACVLDERQPPVFPLNGDSSGLGRCLTVQAHVWPQLENLASYFTGLTVSPDRTISLINDAFYANKDQSDLSRFLTDARRIVLMAFS